MDKIGTVGLDVATGAQRPFASTAVWIVVFRSNGYIDYFIDILTEDCT